MSHCLEVESMTRMIVDQNSRRRSVALLLLLFLSIEQAMRMRFIISILCLLQAAVLICVTISKGGSIPGR